MVAPMTDQPDLKARVEELRRDLRVLADYSIPLPDPGRVKRTAKGAEEQIAALLSRITELEAERDEWQRLAEQSPSSWLAREAAESRLALADRLAEAAKVFKGDADYYEDDIGDDQAVWPTFKVGDLRALSAALAAYDAALGASS